MKASLKILTLALLAYSSCAQAANEEYWMWGHHPDSFDVAAAKGENYNFPKGRRIDMADACRQLGVDKCAVVRWRGLPASPCDGYARQFASLSEFGWSVTDSAPESFPAKCDEAVRIGDKLTNLTTYFFDDFFCGEYKKISPEQVRAFRNRIRNVATPGRVACVLYADTNGVNPEYKPWLDEFDAISFWFWNGKNLDTMRAKVQDLRKLVGNEKTVLLGIYLWDFGGKKPLTRAETAAQLATAGALLDAGLVNGLIFHCTPLVDLGLESVDCAREWLKARRAAQRAAAPLKLAPVFSDGAVLQRGRPVPVWGTAAAGACVTVSFAGQTKAATAAADGTWRVNLDPMPASKEGREMTVTAQPLNSSTSQLRVRDILVGEVWFVSGQSNAVCPIWCETRPNFRDFKGGTVIQYINRDDVRFTDTPGEWKKMNRRTLTSVSGVGDGSFSALGVYFALKLNYVLGVPVGMLGNYMNGSPIRYWVPDAGGAFYRSYVKRWAPYALTGLLWNQGDSDKSYSPEKYCDYLHRLYDGWSKDFENPTMSFYIQEQSHGNDDCFQISLGQEKFVREEPHAAISGGNDLMLSHVDAHGNDKEWMARRMLLHALKRDYGYADIDNESPIFASATVESNAVVCTFANARTLYLYNAKSDSKRAPFEILSADGVWHEAHPEFPPFNTWGGANHIPTNVFKVVSKDVSAPVGVRYLGAKRSFGNVYNQAALPMLPFIWKK